MPNRDIHEQIKDILGIWIGENETLKFWIGSPMTWK